jgi:hypothetical protein
MDGAGPPAPREPLDLVRPLPPELCRYDRRGALGLRDPASPFQVQIERCHARVVEPDSGRAVHSHRVQVALFSGRPLSGQVEGKPHAGKGDVHPGRLSVLVPKAADLQFMAPRRHPAGWNIRVQATVWTKLRISEKNAHPFVWNIQLFCGSRTARHPFSIQRSKSTPPTLMHFRPGISWTPSMVPRKKRSPASSRALSRSL